MIAGSPVEVRPKLSTEAGAGLTTFFTMAYIVVVNPSILATEGTGMPFSGALTATVLVCFTLTLLMGVYARLPFAVAPGMGLNAFFTYTIVIGRKVPWPVALGMTFWAGVLFVAISVTPVREAIARAIPAHIRTAAAAGIGLFLAFIGLKNAGFIAADPVTYVKFGALDHKALLCLTGVAIAVALLRRDSRFAFLAAILTVTTIAWVAGLTRAPARLVSMPDFQSVFLKLDIRGALELALVPSIVAIMFTDLFDSISTLIGVSQATGLVDAEGHPKNLRQGLIVDALATLLAGVAGSSAGTAYVESAAGIQAGGRTGRTAVFTALCFLPCFFLAPLAGMVPAYATASVLILVGAIMFGSVRRLPSSPMEETVPAFLTLILIPLTFSITQGLLWGFVSHVGLFLLVGRRRDLHPVLYVLAAVSAGLLVLELR